MKTSPVSLQQTMHKRAVVHETIMGEYTRQWRTAMDKSTDLDQMPKGLTSALQEALAEREKQRARWDDSRYAHPVAELATAASIIAGGLDQSGSLEWARKYATRPFRERLVISAALLVAALDEYDGREVAEIKPCPGRGCRWPDESHVADCSALVPPEPTPELVVPPLRGKRASPEKPKQSTARVAQDGEVSCRACSTVLGKVFKEEPPCGPPWWAEHTDGEAAGFGPEEKREGAVLLLTAHHECSAKVEQ